MLFRRKETVTRSDYSTGSVFYLNQGYIRLYTVSAEGNELMLHIFSPSSVFPILWNKIPQPSEYHFESLTPVEVYQCHKDKLKQFIDKNPAASLEIMRQLSSFSESMIKKLESKIFGDAYQQVVNTVLDLAKCFSQKDKGSAIINYWFTHQDIANITGLSRERVTLEINKLIEKKLLSYNNHFIVIPKLELLNLELEKK